MRNRRATSHDVARSAGVSQGTVSVVLNDVAKARVSEATRQRVRAAAQRLDYHPNAAGRSLVRQRTGLLGLILRQGPDRLSANAFLPTVIDGFTAVAGAADFRLLIEPIDELIRPDAYLALAREAHVDGIVLAGARSDDDQLRRLHTSDFPIVLWGQLSGSHLPFVDVHNAAAARTAVEHLIELGHRRIGCITNGPLAYTASAARLQGYQSALESHGLSVDHHLIRIGDFSGRSGYVAMRSLLTSIDRPGAVFVGSDEVALGALRAIRELGLRIPDDVAVVGFDDLPVSELVSPSLSTMRVPARELGAAAARMLIQRIESDIPPPPVLLETELVVRESSGGHIRSY